MRRCCGRFWRKCKPSRFAVSENQPYGRRPVGSPRDGLCPGIGSWGRNVAHECRWEVKCPCASPDFDFRHRIRVGQTALEFIWIRKPLNCVKPTDYRVGVEKCGLGAVDLRSTITRSNSSTEELSESIPTAIGLTATSSLGCIVHCSERIVYTRVPVLFIFRRTPTIGMFSTQCLHVTTQTVAK